MLEPHHPLTELLRQDSRYPFDAYLFVFEALRYAQSELGLGTECDVELIEPMEDPSNKLEAPERHVTGKELCEAIRLFALEQFGYMAKPVLENWGITRTGDFGEIVFNLIKIGQMRKTKQDKREDFEDAYDFDIAFRKDFKITPPHE